MYTCPRAVENKAGDGKDTGVMEGVGSDKLILHIPYMCIKTKEITALPVQRMVQYSGVYTHAGEENLATYLQTIGVPPAARKAAGDAPPSLGHCKYFLYIDKYFSCVEISQSGSEWSMTWRTARMNNTVQFTLGEEFEEKGFGGKVVKVQTHF